MAAQVTSWIGQKLGSSPYRVVRGLSAGGMALVFLAEDMHDGSRVVVKSPRPDAPDPSLAARFGDEIRALASLRHPHIVPLLDHGEHQGVPFLVLPYLQGGSLLERWRKQAPSEDLSSLLSWLPQVAQALDFLNGQGWLHRDVKPANILFEVSGAAFLADLGLTKTYADPGRPGLTRIGAPAPGTPRYMAPEMLTAEAADGRADQFSLAVMLYEGLSGQSPFPGDNPHQVLRSQALGHPPPLHRAQPGLPEPLSAVLTRGMALRRDHRYPTCAEFVREVLGALNLHSAQTPVFAGQNTWSIPEAAIPALPEPILLPPRPQSNPSQSVPPTPVYTVYAPPSSGPGRLSRFGRALVWLCLGLFVGGLILAGSPLQRSLADPFSRYLDEEIGWPVPWARFRKEHEAKLAALPGDKTFELKAAREALDWERNLGAEARLSAEKAGKDLEATRLVLAGEKAINSKLVLKFTDLTEEGKRNKTDLEKSKGETKGARAEAETAQAELEKSRGEAKGARAEAKKAQADLVDAQAKAIKARGEATKAQGDAIKSRGEATKAQGELVDARDDAKRARAEMVELDEKVKKAVSVHDELKLYIVIHNKTPEAISFKIQAQFWDGRLDNTPFDLEANGSRPYHSPGAIWLWVYFNEKDFVSVKGQLFFVKDDPAVGEIDARYQFERRDGKLYLSRVPR